MSIIVGRVAFDYATITTYGLMLADRVETSARAAIGSVSKWENFKVMQYEGVRGSGIDGSSFIGMGEQRGRPHYMISVSGSAADNMLGVGPKWLPLCVQSIGDDGYIREPVGSPTRLDVQLTLPTSVPIEDMYGLFTDYAKRISEQEELRGKRSRTVEVQGTTDGFMTIYVGARTSPKRYCIYVKKDDSDNLYIRFEVRFKKKGGYSSKVLNGYANGRDSFLVELIAGEIDTLPSSDVISSHAAYVADYDRNRVTGDKVVQTELGTLSWLRRTVAPTFKRLLSSDGIVGVIASSILDDIVAHRDKLEGRVD